MLGESALIVVAFVLVLLNGFFVAAEFAIVKVRRTRIDELLARGSRRARLARPILDHLEAYLAACQVGITIASLALGWIGEPALARLLHPLAQGLGLEERTSALAVHGAASSIVAFGIISFLHIVVGEQAPKAWAIQDSESMTLRIALPLRIAYAVLYPGIWVTNRAANLMLHGFGLRSASEKDLAYSPEELELIVATSAEAGALDEHQRRLFENAINLSAKRVREIMVPRMDMVYLLTTDTLEKSLAIIREQQHTRYPLAAADRERVLGMIHTKDLLDRIASGEREIQLEKIVRPVIFVPEVASLDRLLRRYQRTRTHMAIVVDEYGSVAGLVTLEDILEELVGQIRDEFDVDEEDAPVIVGGADETVVEAWLPVDQVAAKLGFKAVGAQATTIGGYVLQLLGRLPRVGSAVVVGPWRVEVAEMEGLRLTQLRFRRKPEGQDAATGSATTGRA